MTGHDKNDIGGAAATAPSLIHRGRTALLLLFFSIAGLFSASSYPGWFLYQKDYPGIVVGYSNKGLPASADAEQRYVTYRGCLAMGELYRFQDWDQKHSDYYYEYSPDSLLNIRGKLNVLARFAVNLTTQDFISAFSLHAPEDFEHEMFEIADIAKPDWTDRGPYYSEGQYLYGVGIYSFRANENDAWRTAEEQAIFNIMSYREVEMHSISISERSESGDRTEKLNVIRIKYLLNNIEVMERWRDAKGTLLYVLVRVHSDNIKNLLK